MTDTTGPTPSGGDDTSYESIRSIANGLPAGAFGFDEDDEAPSGGDAPPAPAARQPAREAEPGADEQTRPAGDRPRAPDGRFAPKDAAGDGETDPAAQQAPGDEDPQAAQAEADPNAEPQEPDEAKPDGKRLDFIEIDGRRYSPEDVQRGFLRTEDYSRKTGELSRERQAVQQRSQQIQGYEQQLSGILEIAVAALRDSLPAQPDAALIDSDLVGYHKQMAAHNAAVQKLQTLAQHREQMGQQTQAEAQQAERDEAQRLQQHQHQQFTLLQEKIPELRDERARGTFFQKAGEYAGRYGLSLQEIGDATLNDHRIALVLKDAMLGSEVRAQRPATVDRLKAAPPIRPAPRPASGTRDGQAKRAANEQFVRNPSLKTALAAGVLDDVFPDF